MAKYRFEQIAINCTEKKMPTDEDRLTYIGLEHLDTGCLTISRWGSAVPLKGEKLVMRRGDVLLGKRNAYLRRADIAPHDGIFSAHGMVLRPREEVIDKAFFPLFIASDYFFDEAIRISVGSLSPTVNWKDLRITEFELPDLETQRKLASVLWAINDTIEAYKRLISVTDELVKSQFIEWFGSGNPGNRMTTVEECCASINGGGTPSMSHPEYYGGDIPFIKSGDVKFDYVSKGALWLTSDAIEKTTARLLPAGTVLVVVRSAALKNEFHVAIAENPLVINQDLKALQPKDGIVPEYLMWAIKLREHEILQKVQTMLTSHIEIRDILNLPVKRASTEEQAAWKAFVRQSDKSKFAVLNCLKRNLLLILQKTEDVHSLINQSAKKYFCKSCHRENHNG